MSRPALKLAVATAAVVFVTGSAAVAWWKVERQQAQVKRLAPAVVPFDRRLVSQLRVPEGFAVSIFAQGLKAVRMMDVAEDGTVLVTRRDEGDVLALRDANGDGVAELASVFARDLPGVHGVDIEGDTVYLASATTVWKAPLAGGSSQVIIAGLPDGGQHPNRMVRVGPDGDLYIAIGSSCNDCAEENLLERGTIVRYSPDGRRLEVFANGLRNTIGYDWQPASRALWGMDHGSDFRGDDIPPEELNRIERGANYGWPICHGAREVDGMTNARPEKLALQPGQAEPDGRAISRARYCAQTLPAVLTLPAHAAPMAMRFYGGTQFPPAWRNDAFVALHGSWNRGDPVGYKVVRLRFSADGKPLAFDDFLTGFLGADRQFVTGRPVGIVTARDGALLVSDDANGVIYRVAYQGG